MIDRKLSEQRKVNDRVGSVMERLTSRTLTEKQRKAYRRVCWAVIASCMLASGMMAGLGAADDDEGATISKLELETAVAEHMNESYGQQSSADCEGGLASDDIAHQHCTWVRDDGAEIDIDVRVTSGTSEELDYEIDADCELPEGPPSTETRPFGYACAG